MSDSKSPADELAREEEIPASADEPANKEAPEQAEESSEELEEQLDLPEGANLIQLLIEAQKQGAGQRRWLAARPGRIRQLQEAHCKGTELSISPGAA